MTMKWRMALSAARDNRWWLLACAATTMSCELVNGLSDKEFAEPSTSSGPSSSSSSSAGGSGGGGGVGGGGPASWAFSFGSDDNDNAPTIDVDAAGNVVVAGYTEGQVVFPDRTVGGAGGKDVLVVKRAADGSHLWAMSAGGNEDDLVMSVAVDTNGDAIVAIRSASSSIDVGCGAESTTISEANFVLAKLAGSDGACVWSRAVGLGAPFKTSVAIGDNDEIFVVGAMEGELDFGDSNLLPLPAMNTSLFVAKLTSEGAHQWSRAFGGDALSSGRIVEVAQRDGVEVVVAGTTYASVIDFGGGPLAGGPERNMVVLALDANGEWVWSKRYANGDTLARADIAIDADGEVFVGVETMGDVDFDGTIVESAGASDLAIVKLSIAGEQRWVRHFGGPENDIIRGLAVDSQGRVVLGGSMQATVSFGGDALSSVADWSLFVAKLEGDTGAHISSGLIEGTSWTYGDDIAIGPEDAVLFCGQFVGSARPSGEYLESQGGVDVVVGSIPSE